MHHEVERAPGLLRGREHRVDGRGIGHVAMAEHTRADLLRQRLDALLERIALIGEGNVGALGAAGLGDAPGQRPVVGDPQDQTALAAHETRGFRHNPPQPPEPAEDLVWHRACGPSSTAHKCRLQQR